jgi:adenosylcobinamide-GDP ribazoletransferase
MLRALADLGICIGFYTRLPVPSPALAAGEFARASWASPLAGALVGLSGAAAYAGAHTLGLPPAAAAAMALAATLLLTGCLHEDGLADMADGFGGGRTPERKLEIMRDSRLGTYAVCALLLSLLLRWSALMALAEPQSVAAALVAAHAAARSLIPAFMRWLPPARTEGLSAAAGLPPPAAVAIAALLGMASLLLLGISAAMSAAVLLAGWGALLGRSARRQIGGQTGDVLGGLEQGGEIVVLLAAVVAFG